MRRTQTLVAMLATVASLSACGGGSKSGPPVTPQAVSTHAVAVATPIVRQLSASLAALGSNARVQDLLDRLGVGATTSFQLRSGVAVRESALTSAPRRGAISAAAGWVRRQLEQTATSDEEAQRFADFLRNRVFTEANLESSDATSATFLMRGAVLCADPAMLPDEVAACAQQLDAMKLRIRAIPHGETAIDLELLVGDARAKPVTLALTNTPSVAVTLDLAAAKDSVEFLGQALGAQVEDLPAVMRGVVTVSLAVENETRLTIDSAISQAIDLQVDGASSPIRIYVGVVASPFRLVADSVAQTVEVGGRLASVALAGPDEEQLWNDATQTFTTVTHQMDVTLTSASASALLRQDGTARATFDLRGLEVERDGATLATASLASACVVEVTDATVDFVAPLDAQLSGRDEADALVSYAVHAAGAFAPTTVCDDLGNCDDWLELLAGASFDLTGGASEIHAIGPNVCVNLDAQSVGACPVF